MLLRSNSNWPARVITSYLMDTLPKCSILARMQSLSKERDWGSMALTMDEDVLNLARMQSLSEGFQSARDIFHSWTWGIYSLFIPQILAITLKSVETKFLQTVHLKRPCLVLLYWNSLIWEVRFFNKPLCRESAALISWGFDSHDYFHLLETWG